MKEIHSTISSKGQVTLPAEVRQTLGVKQGDKIAFMVDDDQVRVRRTGSVVAMTSGIFKSWQAARTAEELRQVAEEAIAEEGRERS